MLIQFPIFYEKSLVINDLRFMSHKWFNDLKSLEQNQPKFDLLFKFIIQLSSNLAQHWRTLSHYVIIEAACVVPQNSMHLAVETGLECWMMMFKWSGPLVGGQWRHLALAAAALAIVGFWLCNLSMIQVESRRGFDLNMQMTRWRARLLGRIVNEFGKLDAKQTELHHMLSYNLINLITLT